MIECEEPINGCPKVSQADWGRGGRVGRRLQGHKRVSRDMFGHPFEWGANGREIKSKLLLIVDSELCDGPLVEYEQGKLAAWALRLDARKIGTIGENDNELGGVEVVRNSCKPSVRRRNAHFWGVLWSEKKQGFCRNRDFYLIRFPRFLMGPYLIVQS